MATDYGKRLKTARKHAKLTQRALAQAVGISQGTLSELETIGHGSAYTYQLAATCGVNPQWLATGDGGMLDPIPPNFDPNAVAEPAPSRLRTEIPLVGNPEYPAVRRVRFKLCAGASGFGIEYLDEPDCAPIVFKKHWFESRGYIPEKLFATHVCNGSMEPGLYDGDTVVVNTADTKPVDTEVFALNYEGELVVKRLIRDSGQWWLSSDNPDQRKYPRKACTEDVFIIGRIVHKQSERI